MKAFNLTLLIILISMFMGSLVDLTVEMVKSWEFLISVGIMIGLMLVPASFLLVELWEKIPQRSVRRLAAGYNVGAALLVGWHATTVNVVGAHPVAVALAERFSSFIFAALAALNALNILRQERAFAVYDAVNGVGVESTLSTLSLPFWDAAGTKYSTNTSASKIRKQFSGKNPTLLLVITRSFREPRFEEQQKVLERIDAGTLHLLIVVGSAAETDRDGYWLASDAAESLLGSNTNFKLCFVGPKGIICSVHEEPISQESVGLLTHALRPTVKQITWT